MISTRKKKGKKIGFVASSGGHYDQIMMLSPLLDKYDGFFLTEKSGYKIQKKGIKIYYILQVNRKEWFCLLKLIINAFVSLWVYIKERPDIIISTGVLATIPMCLLVKVFGKKLIYIESFAKISSPTKTGKLMYKLADRFFIQWESLKEFYPKAEYLGMIY